MKRFGIFGICVLMFIFRCYQMEHQPVKTYDVITNAPTLAEYNQMRYEKYLGEPVEPIVYSEAEECRFTQEEIDLLARVVMSEVGKECFEVKQALAETIINRLDSDYKEFRYQTSIDEVIYTPSQWSTQDNGDPTQECYEAVYAAIKYDVFPDDMLWARANYVSYGYEYVVNKDSITKFSTVTDYNEVYE